MHRRGKATGWVLNLRLQLGYEKKRAHRGSNTGPHDLQSYALPLSYKPTIEATLRCLLVFAIQLHSEHHHPRVEVTRCLLTRLVGVLCYQTLEVYN